MLAIPGTGNPDHLVENVPAGALRLSDDELARLDGHTARNRPRTPGPDRWFHLRKSLT